MHPRRILFLLAAAGLAVAWWHHRRKHRISEAELDRLLNLLHEAESTAETEEERRRRGKSLRLILSHGTSA
jgi:hypothetical protein